MFMGSLSGHTERKTRNVSKKNEGNVEQTVLNESKDKYNTTLAAPGEPLIFTAENPDIPREVMLGYLNTCTAMMLKPENMQHVLDIDAETPTVGLHVCLMNFQRDVLEYNFHIERNHGCQFMSKIPAVFPDDTQMHASAKRFMFICMRAYLNAVKLRAPSRGELRRTGVLSRVDILEFFEGANALMCMPESKKLLKAEYERLGKPPAEKAIELQRSILELLGIDAEWGCNELNKVRDEYADDQEVMMKMKHFATCAELSCSEAMMSEQEKTEFYAKIPSFMHHFPHVFVAQQRIQMEHQQKMQHQNMHMKGNMTSEQWALQQQRVMQQQEFEKFTKSSAGSEKISQLTHRMDGAKEKAAQICAEMSHDGADVNQNKLEFFESFLDNPIVSKLKEIGTSTEGENPMVKKMDYFLEVPEEDLVSLMTFQQIMAEDMKNDGTESSGILKQKIGEVLKEMGQESIQMSTHSHGAAASSAAATGQVMDR